MVVKLLKIISNLWLCDRGAKTRIKMKCAEYAKGARGIRMSNGDLTRGFQRVFT